MLKGLFRIFNLINRRSTLCIGIWCIIVFERNNDKPFNLQTEPKKKKSLMLKIVKKPQPLSSLSTIFIRLQNGRKKKSPSPLPLW